MGFQCHTVPDPIVSTNLFSDIQIFNVKKWSVEPTPWSSRKLASVSERNVVILHSKSLGNGNSPTEILDTPKVIPNTPTVRREASEGASLVNSEKW